MIIGMALSTDTKVANGKAVYGTPQTKSGLSTFSSSLENRFETSLSNSGRDMITLRSK